VFLHIEAHEKNKIQENLSKVPLAVKTATHKFDYVLRMLRFNATRFLVTFFKSQAHLHFTAAIVSLCGDY